MSVTGGSAVDLYYDPFDFAIDDNPYPTWKRLRNEAPLYHNEKFNFYALSRYEDVSRELPNYQTYRSGRGTTMDVIMSGIEVPPGVILFEDPPLHDLHRRVLSKVFTPRRMEEIEPLTRQYCVRTLDPLIGRAGSISSPISAPRFRCARSATYLAFPSRTSRTSGTGPTGPWG